MGLVRTRLSLMMFLQYFVWGAWGVEIGGYMGDKLGFTGLQIGAIYSSTAIAAMISPLFMGYVADRLFSTEKILGLLHLVGAAFLGAAAFSDRIYEAYPQWGSQFGVLFPVMIGYALCYMPTLALTNSISFENINSPEKEFPIIRFFGTAGWIVAGVVVGSILHAAPGGKVYPLITSMISSDSVLFAANNFLVMAAGASVLLGVYCFTLPYTPPKQATVATQDLGQRKSILNLLADPSFLVFTLASFLICIPLAFYYNQANFFLTQIEAPEPTTLQTLGQISELFFMAAMPLFITSLGVKRMLAIGMLAWVLRYVFFASLNFPLIVVGLVLHGICFDFFFVASQIYVDNKADISQRASAQSFIAFVTLGLGMFVGAYASGYIVERYPPMQVATVTESGSPRLEDDGSPTTAALPNWDIKGKTGLAAQLKLGPTDSMAASDLPATFTDADSKDKLTYLKQDLATALAKADLDQDGRVSRPEWRAARSYDWSSIWLWPAIAAGATLLFFWLGFHDKITPSAGPSASRQAGELES